MGIFLAVDILTGFNFSPEFSKRINEPDLGYFDCRGQEFIQILQSVPPIMVKKLMNITIVYACN
jgi:hypothetical protein